MTLAAALRRSLDHPLADVLDALELGSLVAWHSNDTFAERRLEAAADKLRDFIAEDAEADRMRRPLTGRE